MITPKIVLVGHVCVDHNKSENAVYKGWGSPLLYMSQYLRKAYQVDPIVIANYGADIVKYMPPVTILPVQPSRLHTLVYENDSSSGQRIQRTYNLDVADPPEITADVAQAVSEADILILAPLLANVSTGYVRELLDHARPSCLKILCPQGYFRQVDDTGLVSPREFTEAAGIIPLFNLVLYSEEDHPEAFELASGWERRTRTSIIVTQGSAGASIIERGKTTAVPTTPVPPEQIIDSVGCGDTFAATVGYEYWQNRDLEAAVRAGHVAASAKLLTYNNP